MIEQRNLFKIQSKLAKDSKNIPVKGIEKNYVLSWILVGIAKSSIHEILIFKGGTALKKFYFPEYRFSEDLDFTLSENISAEDLKQELEKVYDATLDMSNIKLALKSMEIHPNGYTFYINFSGPLNADISKGEIKTDFTVNEKIITSPIEKRLLVEYKEYEDIPKDIKLKVYTLEEMCIEKYLSILDKSRNEPRDIYDLWYLLHDQYLEIECLGSGIKEKGANKGIKKFGIITALDRKENNYKKLWTKRLDTHMAELPHFEKVYRELKRYLRPLSQSL